jgi:hypothetical protein
MVLYRRPKTPVDKLAQLKPTFQEPASAPVATHKEIDKEDIVKIIMRVCNHFSSKNRTKTDTELEDRMLTEFKHQIKPIFYHHSELAIFTLDVLWNNYQYYCKKTKVRSSLDGMIEKLLITITRDNCSDDYRAKVSMMTSLVMGRAVTLNILRA